MPVALREQRRPATGGSGREGGGRLSREHRVTLALLGVPTLALALAVTTVTSYVPVLARDFLGSTLVIGLIVGSQGAIALVLPVVAGTWSDRLRTRVGGRLPFILAATPVAVIALLGMGFIGSLGAMLLTVLPFFAAYFIAYEPYRALYPDAVPDEAAGRGQSSQAVFRGVGTALALVGGSLGLGLGRPAPFIAAAVVFAVAMGAFAWALVRRGVPRSEREPRPARDELRHVRDLVRGSRELRAYLTANALWELQLGALQTFVILYVTVGLGFGAAATAGIVGGTAAFVLVGAAVSGRLGDRIGNVRVLSLTLPVYGVGLLLPLFSTSPAVLVPAAAIVGAGGGIVMALPYAVLIPLMPPGDRGSLSGLYSASRGIGLGLGPLLAGLLIGALGDPLAATDGLAAMWLVMAVAVGLSLVPLRRLARAERERAGRRAAW